MHTETRPSLVVKHALNSLLDLFTSIRVISESARLVVRCLESGSLAGSAGNEALLNLSSLVQGPAR